MLMKQLAAVIRFVEMPYGEASNESCPLRFYFTADTLSHLGEMA
jgi:hypothetical protein